jgi:hypothetical protein
MSSSSADHCTEDEGLDYIFGYMAAVYGTAFTRNWDGVDPGLVRGVWRDQLGRFLTYRPSLDYALRAMHPDFPPSAIAFRDSCNKGPAVPRQGEQAIAYDPNVKINPEAKRRGMEALAALRGKLGLRQKFEAEE